MNITIPPVLVVRKQSIFSLEIFLHADHVGIIFCYDNFRKSIYQFLNFIILQVRKKFLLLNHQLIEQIRYKKIVIMWFQYLLFL